MAGIRAKSGNYGLSPPSLASSAAIRAARASFSLARLGRHFLDRLELFARHDVHAGEQALELGLHHRLDLASRALGEAGGVGDQARQIVKQATRWSEA